MTTRVKTPSTKQVQTITKLASAVTNKDAWRLIRILIDMIRSNPELSEAYKARYKKELAEAHQGELGGIKSGSTDRLKSTQST